MKQEIDIELQVVVDDSLSATGGERFGMVRKDLDGRQLALR
jgi:hypothetical protein